MGLPLLRAPGGALPAGVVHGFTTRAGGVSGGPRASLNLAAAPGVPDAELTENWRRALAALAPGLGLEHLVLMRQVHGAEVALATSATGPLGSVGAVDAVVTTTPGLALAVRVADCVPILLAAPGAVGAVHAGWRGVAAGVVGRALDALCGAAGCDPGAVAAVVGPHVGAAVYEVGEEVVEGLRAAGVPPEVAAVPHADRWRADLGGAVAWQLHAAGVSRVHVVGGCTSGPDHFSHRFDGQETGRQAGVVALWP